MRRTRIKICGITNSGDALYCASRGVDAIGLVFYEPSPRNVSLAQAEAILASLPPFLTVVGLFMNPDAGFVEEINGHLPLDVLQFHGQESAAFCEAYDRPYIKAVAMGDGDVDFTTLEAEYSRAQAFLLDSHKTGKAGGSGATFDWLKIPRQCHKPLILAGGLEPGNVQSGILKARPYAVDCSSGVELKPGIKDHGKILQFVENVADVDASN